MLCKGFDIQWQKTDLIDIIGRFPKSELDHNVRLLEAETAYDLGIPFDNTWYNMPVEAREYMIATRLARNWIQSLANEKAVQDAKNKR